MGLELWGHSVRVRARAMVRARVRARVMVRVGILIVRVRAALWCTQA